MTSGTMADLDSLQDLRYTYDPNGNVLTIQDYKAGSPQTQTFTYDNLDRLSTGVTSGGTGGTYSLQSYNYSSSTGNLSSKAGVSYTYDVGYHDHAVIAMGTSNFTYDANGNQVTRNVGGSAYTLNYDAENRLVSVSGALTATFYYDGDGNRVKGTIGGVTTAYVGNYFEWTGNTTSMKKYYYAGNTRVAERTGSTTLNYLLGDHLGSQAITTNSSGGKTGEIRYYPWGTERYTYGTTPTSYHFTGQRLESSLGLYYYGARWYDPMAGRFVQADSIIPEQSQGVQAWDRYAYVNNNPVKYTDPTGHKMVCDPEDPNCDQEARQENLDDSKENSQIDNDIASVISDDNEKNNDTTNSPQNPPIDVLIITGVTITGVAAVAEGLLVTAESTLAPIAATGNPIAIGFEFVIIGAELVIVDLDAAYWSYTYRVYKNPNIHQEFILLPWWGMNK